MSRRREGAAPGARSPWLLHASPEPMRADSSPAAHSRHSPNLTPDPRQFQSAAIFVVPDADELFSENSPAEHSTDIAAPNYEEELGDETECEVQVNRSHVLDQLQSEPVLIQTGVYKDGRLRALSDVWDEEVTVSPNPTHKFKYNQDNPPYVLQEGLGVPLDVSDVVLNYPPEEGKPVGIIGPHKLPNPVRDSREHRNMHREIKDKYKRGDLFVQKSELRQKMDGRRDRVERQQQLEQQMQRRTSLDIALQQRACKLNELDTEAVVEQHQPDSELRRAFQRVQLASKDKQT